MGKTLTWLPIFCIKLVVKCVVVKREVKKYSNSYLIPPYWLILN